jgi:hypothetical protein
LGKHTTVGSPVSGPHDDDADNGEDGGDSLLSADPEQDAAEEIVEDIGEGLAKSGEALVRGQ